MKSSAIAVMLALLSVQTFGQAWDMGSDFAFSKPTGGMTRDMNNAFGFTLDVARNFKSPLSIGGEMQFATYGSQTSRQAYTFSDGSVTETDVRVSNDIFNLNLTGKYFFRNEKNVNPYLSAKVGWTWFTTTLTIEDPDDEFSCHPLENDVLQRDNSYTMSAGGGVRVDFNTFFRNMDRQRFFFDIAVHTIQGGIIRYMNVNNPSSTNVPESDVMAKFINTQSQVIHEHHVGSLYTSVISMMEYRLGVVCRPGW